jgi:hypothetical protein
MGRPKHTHWLQRCVALEFEALYFVNYLQDGLTKTHALRALQRCVAIENDALFFVKYLQDVFTSTHALITAMRCSRVWCFVLCQIFARWVDQNTRIEVIPAMRCSLEFDALYRGKIFARWVYKHARIEFITAMRCSLEFDALYRGKIFARWVYLNTRIDYSDALLSSLMLCFVKYLQDVFTKTRVTCN